MKNATFRQLRIFVEVAKNLSFVRAAETLFLTPPAVTMQIKELESQIGMPLFDRQGKKVTLTTVGEYLVIYARKILALVKEAEITADKLRRAQSGLITVGMVGTSCYFVLPLIAQFQAKYPEVDFKVNTGNSEHMGELLRAGEVDLVIMGRPPKEMKTRAEPFFLNPLVFVAHPQHPLAELQPRNVEDLRFSPLIGRERGSSTRTVLEEFLMAHNITPQYKMEVEKNEVLKQALLAGLGVSLVSLHTVAYEIRQGLLSILPIEDTPIMRSWFVVQDSTKSLSPISASFQNFLVTDAKQGLGEKIEALIPKFPPKKRIRK